jgi:hypothetical protein
MAGRIRPAVADPANGPATSLNREHHTQVLPEQLSRAFAKARDAQVSMAPSTKYEA